MMRLPGFRYRAPRTIEDAATWLAEDPETTMLLAGGTDLLPNMKRRQQTPSTLIGLRSLGELTDIRNGDGLAIGAGVTLSSLIADPRIRQAHPGLWQAAAQVATPHLRNMGTVGGNLCLDTRCTYYDQNYEWRKSIDFCLKKDGRTCWVATSSPTCLAVSSADTAPMLQALGATVTLVSAARGQRRLPVAELYANDGMHYLTKRPDEILTSITLPASDGWRSSYWKLRRRGAFDFPVAAAAVAARLDGTRVIDVRIVLGAVASRPLEVDGAALLRGENLDDELIATVAATASAVAKPMDNTDFELVWRKKMVHSLVSHALREIRGDDMRVWRRQLARQELLSIRPAGDAHP